MRSQILESIKEENAAKGEEWDRSTKAESQKMTDEDKMVKRLADQVLQQNPKLRGIHSQGSIRKLLEKEAKKQLKAAQVAGGPYQGPVISTVKDREQKQGGDPSNLPYLHKNPAI